MKKGARAHTPSVRRLYAIARDILQAEPTIDNLEWQERIKDKLVQLKFGYPDRLEAIHDAMRAVEGVIHRPAPPPLKKPAPPLDLPEPPLSPEEAKAIIAKLKVQVRTIIATHGETKTPEQIDAYRRAQLVERKPTHRLTPKGWVPI